MQTATRQLLFLTLAAFLAISLDVRADDTPTTGKSEAASGQASSPDQIEVSPQSPVSEEDENATSDDGDSSGQSTAAGQSAARDLDAARRAAQNRVVRQPNGARSTANNTLELDSNAKWVCDQPTSHLEPVWRSNQKLEFAFKIRNAGTAPLKFRAKGG